MSFWHFEDLRAQCLQDIECASRLPFLIPSDELKGPLVLDLEGSLIEGVPIAMQVDGLAFLTGHSPHGVVAGEGK